MTTPGSGEPLDLSELQAALSDAGNPWTAGETSLEDDWTIRLGVPPDPSLPDYDEALAARVKSARARIPTADAAGAFDVRNVDGVSYDSPVRDQSQCGSCVAFGTVAAMEDVYRFTHKITTPINLSEAQVFYCYGRFAGRRCGNGWWPKDALEWERDQGVTTEEYFPYTAGDQECGVKPGWDDHLAVVTAFQDISGRVDAMKQAIASKGAVVASMNIYNDFKSYRSGVYRSVRGVVVGGHCVPVIGYNDAGGYWIVRNSWGTGWGESGYFRIAYGCCGIESMGTYELTGVQVIGI